MWWPQFSYHGTQIAIDQSLKRGITTGFSLLNDYSYVCANDFVLTSLLLLCSHRHDWTPSHLELYSLDWEDLFTVSDIHEQMDADRSEDTKSSNCSGTSHMLCFFSSPNWACWKSNFAGNLSFHSRIHFITPALCVWFREVSRRVFGQ